MLELFKRKGLFLSTMLLIVFAFSGSMEAAKKVLYATHEPGTYHRLRYYVLSW